MSGHLFAAFSFRVGTLMGIQSEEEVRRKNGVVVTKIGALNRILGVLEGLEVLSEVGLCSLRGRRWRRRNGFLQKGLLSALVRLPRIEAFGGALWIPLSQVRKIIRWNLECVTSEGRAGINFLAVKKERGLRRCGIVAVLICACLGTIWSVGKI
jgi:hypothetical protein